MTDEQRTEHADAVGGADAEDPQLPRVLAVAWGIEIAPQRGPRRELTHERIVEAAIELADEQGIEAVTMQRLAAKLGFTTMALYRYVGSKDELHTLMSDAAVKDGGAIAADDADWRAGILDWAEYARGRYLAHPWLLDLPPRPITLLMPGNLRVLDRALRILRPLQLDIGDAIDAVSAMILQIRGVEGIARDFTADPIRLGPAALAALSEVVTPGRFPEIAPVVASGGFTAGLGGVAGTPGDEPGGGPGDDAGGDEWGRSVGFLAVLDGLERLADRARERRDAGETAAPEPTGELTPAEALEAAELRVAEATAARAAAQARVKAAQQHQKQVERALEAAKAARSAAASAAKAAAKAAGSS